MLHQLIYWRKMCVWAARLVAFLFLIGVCGAAIVHAGGKLYQIRAEHLYFRVAQLRVGLSTFDDARTLAHDYRRNAEMQTRDCTSADCRFIIRLTNAPFPAFYDAPLSWKLGVRPAVVAATVSVSDGKVSYADFGVSYRTQYGYWLEGSFHAATELTIFDKCRMEELGRDSLYAVTSAVLTNGDGGGRSARVAFGRAVTDEQRARATDVRLNCLTAIPGCKTLTDLMPKAWEGMTSEAILDESFNVECKQYMEQQERKQGDFPWQLESAFHATPITVNSWILTRPSQ
jgi:hypothetical protein